METNEKIIFVKPTASDGFCFATVYFDDGLCLANAFFAESAKALNEKILESIEYAGTPSGQMHENIHIILGKRKFANRFQKKQKQTQKPNPTCSFAISDKYQKNNPIFIEKN
jgi:hypothetical protein